MVNVKLGEKAPDFSLPDVDLKLRRLHDFLGQNVVIAFFVSAFTGTCTKEACAFRDSMTRLTKLDAQVIGVSINDPFSNRVFSEKNKLPYPILSDYNREVVHQYGLEQHDFSGLKGYTVAKRSIFILDKEGVIRYMWVADDPAVEPDYSEIEKTLENIS